MRTDVKIAAGLLIFLVLLAVSYPFLPYTYYEQDQNEVLVTISKNHVLGTDDLGRDMLARISYGIGVSLRVAFLASVIATILGTILGIISGWFGKTLDIVIMRFIDFFLAIPDIILIVLISFIVGRGEVAIAIAIALGSWTSVARVVRGEVLKIKNAEFVESAIILGNSTFDVIRKHIIPNIIPIVFTMLILRVPVAILTESGLSFIGLGLQPPASSLGVLAEEGFRAISIYPRLIILPAIFISILVWSTNTVFGFVSSKIGRI
ncbi:MAG: ABC transporter permease [Candidatus Calescibacterium sp.]|jgi:oligopeptide transport system permease protein